MGRCDLSTRNWGAYIGVAIQRLTAGLEQASTFVNHSTAMDDD